MRPDDGPKSGQNVSKSGPKSRPSSFYLKAMFSFQYKKLPNIWATFARKFVAKTFKKLSNLVALVRPYAGARVEMASSVSCFNDPQTPLQQISHFLFSELKRI